MPNQNIRLLLVSFFFIISASVFTQTTDVLYLKNGSQIKGKVLEQTEEKTSIETCCGSILVYEANTIEKVETLNTPLAGYIKKSGYFNYTSMGMLMGSEENDKRSIFSVLMEHHYQINPFLSFGGIMGIEYYNESVAPLGGVVKMLLPMNGKSSLFIGISGGYLMPLEDAKTNDYFEVTDTKGGPFANTEIGIIIPSEKSVNMYLALGYRYNELNYVRKDWYYGDVERKITYNRLSIKIGMVLH
ncbi:MAG: hypothetical protein PF517_20405 [Salinivirgaceae bacterium]|jgi:hypothetical protein|nr:hypothetical protein [Salinivirgaceae bacterium]